MKKMKRGVTLGKIVYTKYPEEHLKPKIDLSLFKKQGGSKSFKTYMIQKMKEARDSSNQEMVWVIQHFYKKYLEFETSENFKQESWKHKSGVSFIINPDKVICISFQKFDKGEKAIEIKTELTREEINKVIYGVNRLYKKGLIETRDIAELIYKKSWKHIFSDRTKHVLFTKILNYLEYREDIIYYRSGKIKVLRKLNWW